MKNTDKDKKLSKHKVSPKVKHSSSGEKSNTIKSSQQPKPQPVIHKNHRLTISARSKEKLPLPNIKTEDPNNVDNDKKHILDSIYYDPEETAQIRQSPIMINASTLGEEAQEENLFMILDPRKTNTSFKMSQTIISDGLTKTNQFVSKIKDKKKSIKGTTNPKQLAKEKRTINLTKNNKTKRRISETKRGKTETSKSPIHNKIQNTIASKSQNHKIRSNSKPGKQVRQLKLTEQSVRKKQSKQKTIIVSQKKVMNRTIKTAQKEQLEILKQQNQNYKAFLLASACKVEQLKQEIQQSRQIRETQKQFFNSQLGNYNRHIEANKKHIGHLFSYDESNLQNILPDQIIVESDNEGSSVTESMNLLGKLSLLLESGNYINQEQSILNTSKASSLGIGISLGISSKGIQSVDDKEKQICKSIK